MISRLQSTRLQSNLGQANRRLERWAGNPWRRLSLRLIGLLIGFVLGTAITTVSGALGQIDPVAALLGVIGTVPRGLQADLNEVVRRHLQNRTRFIAFG